MVKRTALRAHEVASLFDVTPKTVTRWAVTGRLPSFKTLGGHRRYDVEVVRRLLEEQGLGERARALFTEKVEKGVDTNPTEE